MEPQKHPYEILKKIAVLPDKYRFIIVVRKVEVADLLKLENNRLILPKVDQMRNRIEVVTQKKGYKRYADPEYIEQLQQISTVLGVYRGFPVEGFDAAAPRW
jgi:hypothetical protein